MVLERIKIRSIGLLKIISFYSTKKSKNFKQKPTMGNSRRKFIRNMAAGSAAMALGGVAKGFSAKSYRRIIGANDHIRLAVIGANGRGSGMAAVFAKQPNTDVIYVCDVE